MTWYIIGAVLGLILIVVFLGNLHISFDPFSISLPRWQAALGYIFIIIGLTFIQLDSKKQAIKHVHEELEESLRKLKSETLRDS